MKTVMAMAMFVVVGTAFQTGAAVRPETAKVALAPSASAGARVGGATHGKKDKLGGETVLPAALAAGVIAGGVVIATKNDKHSLPPSP